MPKSLVAQTPTSQILHVERPGPMARLVLEFTHTSAVRSVVLTENYEPSGYGVNAIDLGDFTVVDYLVAGLTATSFHIVRRGAEPVVEQLEGPERARPQGFRGGVVVPSDQAEADKRGHIRLVQYLSYWQKNGNWQFYKLQGFESFVVAGDRCLVRSFRNGKLEVTEVFRRPNTKPAPPS